MSKLLRLAPEIEIPEADAAEDAIIGAILLDNALIWDAITLVRPYEFRGERNRLVYQTAIELMERGMPVDPITLAEDLRTRTADPVAQQLCRSDLTHFIDAMPRVQNVAGYARQVAEAATARRLQVASSTLMSLASDPDTDADAKRDRAYQIIDSVFGERAVDGMATLADALDEGMVELERFRESVDAGGTLGLSTGLAGIDAMLGGLQRKLYVLAGRPGVGKSALMANWAATAAFDGRRVLLFSTEMQRSEIAFRVMAFRAGIDASAFNSGRFHPEDWHRLEGGREMARTIGDRFLIDHTSAPTPNQIRAKCKSIQRRTGLDLVLIDYLQILGCEGRTSGDTERVTKISNQLKQLQQDIGVPVVVLSQLSRNSTQEKRDPQLHDLRQSGAIEQDCDVAMFLHSTDATDDGDQSAPMQVKLLVRKHRGGRRGSVDLWFDGSRFEFYEGAN